MPVQNACQAGVNLGGWLSQYREPDHDHFKTFINAEDIEQIAGWGMDHVRLPIDYSVVEDDARPGVYKEDGLAYIDRCLYWCKAAGLKVILDLHQAPGYKFDALDRVTLFDDVALQTRFVNLWQALAERYKGEGDYLYLELLNEIVRPDSTPWNALVAQTVSAIRAIDPRRVIVLGGNHYNAPDQLKELQRPADDKILYTFHYYAPLVFTHQKAPWVPATLEYDTTIDYPGECPGLEDFLARHPEHGGWLQSAVGVRLDRAVLATALQPAIDFAQATGEAIYCGEFGVIDRAPHTGRLNWNRDFVGLLREHHIGRACWSYKQMDFGLVDGDSRVIDPELVKIVSER
jgi:endoglucanase